MGAVATDHAVLEPFTERLSPTEVDRLFQRARQGSAGPKMPDVEGGRGARRGSGRPVLPAAEGRDSGRGRGRRVVQLSPGLLQRVQTRTYASVFKMLVLVSPPMK